jgi:hypothetical protein
MIIYQGNARPAHILLPRDVSPKLPGEAMYIHRRSPQALKATDDRAFHRIGKNPHRSHRKDAQADSKQGKERTATMGLYIAEGLAKYLLYEPKHDNFAPAKI